jgi:hypothetical protein
LALEQFVTERLAKQNVAYRLPGSLVVLVTVVAKTVAASPSAVQEGLATFDGSNLEIYMPLGFNENNPE